MKIKRVIDMTIALTKEAKKKLFDASFWFWGICKIFSLIWMAWIMSFMKIPTSFYGIILAIGFLIAVFTLVLNVTMHFDILIQIFIKYFQLKLKRSNNMR